MVERLADGVDLVIVSAAGEREQLRLEIEQPGGAFRKMYLASLKDCRRDRHPGLLISLRLDAHYAGDAKSKLVQQPDGRARLLDYYLIGLPTTRKLFGLCLK
jgi:hypothetical protein